MYESGKASPTAEGTLTRSGERYVVELAREGSAPEAAVVQTGDVVRNDDTVTVPMPATELGQETFGRGDLERAIRALSAGAPIGIRSANGEHIYLLRPTKVHEVRPE